MVAQARQQVEEALGESRKVSRLLAGQLVELDARETDRLGAEDVRAAELAHVFKPHIRSLGWVSSQ
jgi:hypothetical protein